eukprot:GHVR01124318.1.p1 GENE.GHVR01124318.1~~GHVR01124318.1.p1  ORF type:complete len:119 (-),score=14.61 GHVR01124318.1:276-632(-)
MGDPLVSQAVSITFESKGVDVIVTEFTDRLMIVVSETGKIGTIIEAGCDNIYTEVFTINQLFGDRQKVGPKIFSRCMIAHICCSNTKPVLFCLAFHDDDPKRILNLAKALKEQVSFTK